MTLEQLRGRSGLSQREIAEKMKVAITTISNWENAVSTPRTPMIKPLAEALGATIVEVYEAIEETQKHHST